MADLFFSASTCHLVMAGHHSESARQLDSRWDGFYFGGMFSEKSFELLFGKLLSDRRGEYTLLVNNLPPASILTLYKPAH